MRTIKSLPDAAAFIGSCWASPNLLRGGLLVLFALVGFRVGEGRSSSTTKVVEAESFVLRGPDGVKRGEFSIDAEKSAIFSVFDAAGKSSVELISGPNHRGVRITDGAGEPRIGLSVGVDGVSALMIADSEKAPRILMEASQNGASMIHFFDADKRRRLAVGLVKNGEPSLIARDVEGRARVRMRVSSDNAAHLSVGGTRGKSWSGFTGYPNGTIGCEIVDENGKQRISQFVATDDRSYIGLRNTKADDDQITLFTEPNGRAGVSVFDPIRKRSIQMFGDADKGPRLGISGAPGKNLGSLSLDPDGEARLRLMDKDGNITGILGAP